MATRLIGFEVAGARWQQVEKDCGEESQGASIEGSTDRGCAIINTLLESKIVESVRPLQ